MSTEKVYFCNLLIKLLEKNISVIIKTLPRKNKYLLLICKVSFGSVMRCLLLCVYLFVLPSLTFYFGLEEETQNGETVKGKKNFAVCGHYIQLIRSEI